jgi:hypothetical protein
MAKRKPVSKAAKGDAQASSLDSPQSNGSFASISAPPSDDVQHPLVEEALRRLKRATPLWSPLPAIYERRILETCWAKFGTFNVTAEQLWECVDKAIQDRLISVWSSFSVAANMSPQTMPATMLHGLVKSGPLLDIIPEIVLSKDAKTSTAVEIQMATRAAGGVWQAHGAKAKVRERVEWTLKERNETARIGLEKWLATLDPADIVRLLDEQYVLGLFDGARARSKANKEARIARDEGEKLLDQSIVAAKNKGDFPKITSVMISEYLKEGTIKDAPLVSTVMETRPFRSSETTRHETEAEWQERLNKYAQGAERRLKERAKKRKASSQQK